MATPNRHGRAKPPSNREVESAKMNAMAKKKYTKEDIQKMMEESDAEDEQDDTPSKGKAPVGPRWSYQQGRESTGLSSNAPTTPTPGPSSATTSQQITTLAGDLEAQTPSSPVTDTSEESEDDEQEPAEEPGTEDGHAKGKRAMVKDADKTEKPKQPKKKKSKKKKKKQRRN